MPMSVAASVFPPPLDQSAVLQTTHYCSNCAIRHLCLPRKLSPEAFARLEPAIRISRPLRRGGALFRIGDTLHNLYAVRSGALKTVTTGREGREQIIGIHLAGETLGFEGIHTDTHPCTTIALKDSLICTIPYHAFKASCADINAQQQMYAMMSEHIMRKNAHILRLGSLKAEERVATFLLEISLHYSGQNDSSAQFDLCMTRQEIGSYLGVTLETISRTLSKFHKRGLISMRGRHIRIVDFNALRYLL